MLCMVSISNSKHPNVQHNCLELSLLIVYYIKKYMTCQKEKGRSRKIKEQRDIEFPLTAALPANNAQS